jgi:hypothetical protein
MGPRSIHLAVVVVALAAAMEPASVRADIFDNIDTSVEGQSGRPPTFVIVPTIRLAARYSPAPNWSVEVFSRPALGVAFTPAWGLASQVSGGVAVSRDIGDWSVSAGVEAIAGYNNLFGNWSAGAYEFSAQIVRNIAFDGTPWTAAPRVSVNHRATSDPAKVRTRYQLASPFFYKLTQQLDVALVPTIDVRTYANFEPARRDVVANLAAGLRWRPNDGVQLSVFMAYENRWSTLPSVRYSRWLIVPQLSLRVTY